MAEQEKTWKDLSLRERVIGVTICIVVGLLVLNLIVRGAIAAGRSIGILDVAAEAVRAERPTFSRKQCLNRYSYHRFQRSFGDLNDDEFSIVHHHCMAEERAFLGG